MKIRYILAIIIFGIQFSPKETMALTSWPRTVDGQVYLGYSPAWSNNVVATYIGYYGSDILRNFGFDALSNDKPHLLQYPNESEDKIIYSQPQEPAKGASLVSLPIKQFSNKNNFTLKDETCTFVDENGPYTVKCPSIQTDKPVVETKVEVITNNNYSAWGNLTTRFIRKTFVQSDIAYLDQINGNIGVRYDGKGSSELVMFGNVSREIMGRKYYQTGMVVDIKDGTLPPYDQSSTCYEYYSDEARPYPCKIHIDTVYLNGKTYFVNWNIPMEETNTAQTYPVTLEKISNDNIAGSVSVLAKADATSQIAWITKPECSQGKKTSWFKTKVWVDCTTYALSYDGYVGTAKYHKEDSGFGGWFGTFFVALPVATFDPGFFSAGGFGLGLGTNLTPQAKAQLAALSNTWGTRENADNLGVGNWQWKGGFQIVPQDGICGTDNGRTDLTASPVNLCQTGTVANFSGDGSNVSPWSWNCSGSNGGTDSSCSAKKVCQPNWVAQSCQKIPTSETCDNKCGKDITTKTAACIPVDTNACGKEAPLFSSMDCTNAGIPCSNEILTCESCRTIESWKEVKP